MPGARPQLTSGRLFIDTGAFLARAIGADAHHRRAVTIWDELADSSVALYSSDHIFDETLTLLARRIGYPYAAEWGQLHLATKQIQWVCAVREDVSDALKLMQKFADQSISFTDCLSFHLMRRNKIKQAFSFDRHFRAAGFKTLPAS